jgi:hypothetical protein
MRMTGTFREAGRNKARAVAGTAKPQGRNVKVKIEHFANEIAQCSGGGYPPPALQV